MAHNLNLINVITWLQNEEQGQLEKIARVYDSADLLIEEYKTFPSASIGGLCIARTFEYDEFDNLIGQRVFMAEWTAVQEEAASTAISSVILSNDVVLPGTPADTLIAVISAVGGVGPFTFSLFSNPGDVFSIRADHDLYIDEIAVVGSYPIIIKATDSAGQTFFMPLTIEVTSFLNQLSTFFNGVNQYIDCSTEADAQYDGTAAFSISMWQKKVNTAGSQIIVGNTGTLSGFNQVGIIAYFDINASNRVQFQINGGGTNRIKVRGVVGAPALGAWTNIVITYDGTQTAAGVNIYVDGSALSLSVQNDGLTLSSASVEPWTLGAKEGGGNPYLGDVDEVALWDVELSAAEVTELYNSGTPSNLASHSQTANLTHWWRMGDGDTFPTIADQVGSMDGAMLNMTDDNITGDVP